jgi:hypothetical protein
VLLAGFGRNYKTRADDLTDLLMKIMGSRDTEKEFCAEHLLLGCKRLKTARKRLIDSLGTRALTLPLLLHTTIGIEHLLVFLADTNICTRKWYIERTTEAN